MRPLRDALGQRRSSFLRLGYLELRCNGLRFGLALGGERLGFRIADNLGGRSRLRSGSLRSVPALPPVEKLVVNDLLFSSSSAFTRELGR